MSERSGAGTETAGFEAEQKHAGKSVGDVGPTNDRLLRKWFFALFRVLYTQELSIFASGVKAKPNGNSQRGKLSN